MNREQAIARLVDVIHKEARHPWYKRTTDLASLYRKLVTGDGLDDLLQQFVQRESPEAFQQRKTYTQHIVTTVTKNLMDVMEKVPRSNYKRILTAKDEKTTGLLEDVLKKFWGVKSADDYMKTRWLELNATDPNAFLVVEFEAFDHNFERAQPYPFEVYSENAIDYSYQNNVLQYLTVKTPIVMQGKEPKAGSKYTVYLQNETVISQEIHPDSAPRLSLKDGEYTLGADGGWIVGNGRTFLVQFNTPHNAGEVPAKPIGYLRDQWTQGFTYVAPYDSAVPLLMKSIKVNSEMDLTMGKSAFPFRIEYGPKCDAPDCFGGHTSNGAICGVCNGSGQKSVVSAQDKLVLTLPKPGDTLWDLDKLVVFKSPPVDILDFQKKYVDGLTEACKAAMFNSDIFTKQQVSNTATGKRIDLDNVYDTLFKCAMGYAESWQFVVRVSAKFTMLDSNLDARIVFEKDFKLKGQSDLLADLESANRSEAGPVVRKHIQTDIARLIYADSPSDFKRWQVQYHLDPFSGYSETMVGIALSEPAIPERYKVRHLMMGIIFDELEMEAANENKNFYDLPPTEQESRVNKKVEAYMAETSNRATITIPGN